MTASSSPASAPGDSADGPSSTVRLFVTLFFLWHPFAVGLAMLTDTAAAPSRLPTDIKMRAPLVAAYLRTLWMDVAYDFRPTNGQPADVG